MRKLIEVMRMPSVIRIGAALIITVLVSIGPVTVTIHDNRVSAQSGTLVFGQAGFPLTLDPHIDVAQWYQNVFQNIFDSLTRFDDHSLQVVPALAVSWRLVDNTTWEFKLRQGVRFHNGEPFNARAVEFSYKRILDPASRAGVRTRTPAIVDVKVIDDFTVHVITSRPDATVPRGLNYWFIIPPRYFEFVGAEQFVKQPVGTGPFRFSRWIARERIEMVANRGYWRGAPGIERLVIRGIPEAGTRTAALLAGEVHMVENIDLDVIERIRTNPGLQVLSTPLIAALILQFDLLEPTAPLKDKRVRQALNYAVDKETIAKNLFRGTARVLDGQLVTPEAFGYCGELRAYPYDPSKAKELLTAAGYRDGFPLKIYASTGQYVLDAELVTVLHDQLAKVGIDAQVQVLERGAWLDVVAGRRKGPRESFLVAWFTQGDAEFALRFGSSKSPLKYWANDRFDSLIDEALSTFDARARQKLYCDASRLYRDEAPGIFLVQLPFIVGASRTIEGYRPRSDQRSIFWPVRFRQ